MPIDIDPSTDAFDKDDMEHRRWVHIFIRYLAEELVNKLDSASSDIQSIDTNSGETVTKLTDLIEDIGTSNTHLEDVVTNSLKTSGISDEIKDSLSIDWDTGSLASAGVERLKKAYGFLDPGLATDTYFINCIGDGNNLMFSIPVKHESGEYTTWDIDFGIESLHFNQGVQDNFDLIISDTPMVTSEISDPMDSHFFVIYKEH